MPSFTELVRTFRLRVQRGQFAPRTRVEITCCDDVDRWSDSSETQAQSRKNGALEARSC